MTLTPLPPEWLVRISRSKGAIYYYHPSTNQTQWSRPMINDVIATATQNEITASFQEKETVEGRNKRFKLDQLESFVSVAVEKQEEKDVLEALIVASMRVGGSSVTRGTKRVMVFTPWSHQLTAVTNVVRSIQTRTIEDLQVSTETERYLLQHSTGAGKTLTIAALTHQLLYVKDARSVQFHTVVVMLDRIKLNEQVGNVVENYLKRNGVDEVFRAESIEHLAKLLDVTTCTQQQSPQRVIITTTHKMGLLVRDDVLLTRLLHRSSRKAGNNEKEDESEDDKFQRVAIIADEAHRSHTSSTRDAIEKVVKAGKGSHAQLTFIGFTATPNTDALELFGSRSSNGFRRPFHCYPIAQATADGRIMDMLKDYTCMHCEIETSVFPKHVQEMLRTHRGARRRILDYANDDVAILKAKALLMMMDFQAMKGIQPKVKCMIVVRSRRDVVRYYTLITTFVAKKKLGWNCYAAFSGVVTLESEDGVSNSVTEPTLNHRSVTLAISDVIIVCDKLDTGFNEPLLACMYVDRYLRSSARTVQLLSRLNRRHKDKVSVRVLDFANHAAQVRRSFADFWREAKASMSVDIVDETAERLDLVTSIVVLCDHFPELRSAPINIEDPSTFVSERVVSMERDAFQQVIDALRGAVFSFKRLEQVGCSDFFGLMSPFSYSLLCELKKETESHVVAVEEDVEPLLENIKTKMSARLQKCSRSFSGALYPQSLLDRVECRNNVSKLASCLLQFGELERFEALLLMTSARNNQQSIDPSVLTQVTKAANKCSDLAASMKDTAEAQPRMSAQIDAMQQELAAFLLSN
ncbi:unnamed protein product [Peronospora effusa]|uniref:WW domain-containing protein n=1 Tax=Peronospora effusa TaxID=542832 RepID=A0A3M6VJL2_9STRA|nr:hypothetical protein DD238_002720 [Peronospora effusa]RQM16867.1 hypothetical protein DD237_003427 [Peronospora effusa]CAI5710348.1 unnamed protein product [Peronospora effusa]